MVLGFAFTAAKGGGGGGVVGGGGDGGGDGGGRGGADFYFIDSRWCKHALPECNPRRIRLWRGHSFVCGSAVTILGSDVIDFAQHNIHCFDAPR